MLRLMNIETMEYVKNKLNSYELGWTNNGVWNGATDMDRGDWEWATGVFYYFNYILSFVTATNMGSKPC